MKTKILSIITSLLISANIFCVAAFAEESSTSSATASSSSSSASSTESSNNDTTIEKRESNSEVDKLTGNADLIKEKKIIHDSSEMQFIAVTTKDDQVFYILIDYTATSDTNSGEGVVYFLNKVDSSDLLAIANRSDNNVDNTTDNDLLTLTTPESSDDAMTDATTNETSTVDNNSNESENSYSIYIIFGVIGVGFVVGYYFLKIKPKKNAISDDDDDFEIDDYEINEDDEKNT